MTQHASAAPGPVVQPPRVRLPKPGSLFLDRAHRFRHLSEHHPSVSGYLRSLGDLADIQHALLQTAIGLPIRQASVEVNFGDHVAWRDAPEWHDTARQLAARLHRPDQAEAPWRVHGKLAPEEQLDHWAACLLSGDLESLDATLALFVAGALQVHRTAAACRIAGVVGLDTVERVSTCPVCGFLPVASVLQTGGTLHGLRYLVCGMCATEWNRPRIQCVHCGASRNITYLGIDGIDSAAKAEACGDCKTYVKLLNRERDAAVDAVADDVASLALDLLMTDEGYQRLGFNPLLIPCA